MVTKKSLMLLLPLIFISSALTGCFNKMDSQEVKGAGLTYSEYFKTYDKLDQRKTITYYKPISFHELEASLPEQVTTTLHTIDSNRLPFSVDDKKAYLITSKDKNGKIMSQVQMSYLSKSEYDDVDDFLIISITEVAENPLKGYEISDRYDSVGNTLKKEMLTEDLPIYQQIMTTDSAMLYRYYDYNETKKSIGVVGTAANEMYAYYNGYIYHIGYLIAEEKSSEEIQEKMLHLAREYILEASK